MSNQDFSLIGSKEDTLQFLYQMRPLKFKLVDTYGNPLGGHKSSSTFSTNPDGTFDVGVGAGKVLLQQAVFEFGDSSNPPRPETYFGDILLQESEAYLVSQSEHGSAMATRLSHPDFTVGTKLKGADDYYFLDSDQPFEVIGHILNGRIEIIEKLAQRRAELEQI